MDLHGLIVLLLILAAFSLVWWGVSSLALPQPVKVIVLVVIGLLMLFYVANLLGVGTGRLSLR